jgi:hypothetical protein
MVSVKEQQKQLQNESGSIQKRMRRFLKNVDGKK